MCCPGPRKIGSWKFTAWISNCCGAKHSHVKRSGAKHSHFKWSGAAHSHFNWSGAYHSLFEWSGANHSHFKVIRCKSFPFQVIILSFHFNLIQVYHTILPLVQFPHNTIPSYYDLQVLYELWNGNCHVIRETPILVSWNVDNERIHMAAVRSINILHEKHFKFVLKMIEWCASVATRSQKCFTVILRSLKYHIVGSTHSSY